MDLIRIKHDDPTARISYATKADPDEKGGFFVEQRHVEASLDHGWRVVHLEFDDEDIQDKSAREKTVVDAGAALRQRLAEAKLEKAPETRKPFVPKPAKDKEPA